MECFVSDFYGNFIFKALRRAINEEQPLVRDMVSLFPVPSSSSHCSLVQTGLVNCCACSRAGEGRQGL